MTKQLRVGEKRGGGLLNNFSIARLNFHQDTLLDLKLTLRFLQPVLRYNFTGTTRSFKMFTATEWLVMGVGCALGPVAVVGSAVAIAASRVCSYSQLPLVSHLLYKFSFPPFQNFRTGTDTLFRCSPMCPLKFGSSLVIRS